MNFRQKLTTGLATGTAVAGLFTASAFAADVEVGGNVLTSTTVNITDVQQTTVSQTNNQTVNNTVNAKANTGGNSSSFNVGGGTVTTGNATTTVNNTTTAGNNVAVVEGCGCPTDYPSVHVGGNVLSHVGVNLTKVKTASYTQRSTQSVTNRVRARANTGKNHTMFNVGGSMIDTSDARTNVNNTVTGGSNELLVTP